MLRLNKLSAVTMALSVALAACSDGTSLNDEPFAPEESAADLQVVQGAFSASVFESLAISSDGFNLVADTGAAPAALLQASLAAASAGSRWESAAAAEAFAAAGPASGPLVPLEYLGRTYDRDVDGYRHNPARTDAPANGVRFILYAVDPITRDVLDTEIGYVDLKDETNTDPYVARVVVVTGGVERINYTVSATIGVETLGFAVSGYISDGTDEIEVDLSMVFVRDVPVTVATVEHLISIPTRDFEVDARVVFTFNEGDFPSEGGSFEIHVDGQLFATIESDGETHTVHNHDGGELNSAEADAVRDIFDGLEDLFDERFEDFLRPVAWMFEAN